MSAHCADACLKSSLQKAPFRGKTLLALLILRGYQDEYGLVRLSQQDLADWLDIRHPRNLAPILHPLTETGHLMIIPGQGRGHRTRYLLTEERPEDVLLAVLMARVGLTEEEARERLDAWRKGQKHPASPELLPAHAQHGPTEPPPKSSASAEPLGKTSATAESFQAKPSARAEPFHPKRTAETELFTEPSAVAEPFASKRTATAVVLSRKPSARAEPFPKTSGIAEPFVPKSTAPAALFPKTSGGAEPFVGKRTAPAELFTASSLGNASLDRARAGSRAHDLAAANNKPIQKIKQQQQPSLRADLAYARGAGSDAASNKFTLQDAFQHADIQPPTTRYIAREWRERTGQAITPEDVLAWHFYRLHENQRKRRGSEPLEPGYIITRMRQGERAAPAFYDQAQEFLDELACTTPPEQAEDDAHRALEQALTAFLPSLAQVGREGLEKAQAQLPLAARGLASAGITAQDITDFRLYLRLKNQPIPLPNDIARHFVALQDDFLAWKRRHQQAQEHWRSIAQELSLSAPVSIQRMLNEVSPVDLNGALVLAAAPGPAHHLGRLWNHRAQVIRTKLQLDADFQLQFIPLHKDSR